MAKQVEGQFTPSSQNITKSIEALIEKEYLERDDQDRMLYKYKA